MVNERFYHFKIGGNENTKTRSEESISLNFEEHLNETPVVTKKNYVRLIEIRQNKESKEKREKEFLLKAAYNEEMYTANLNLDSIAETL